MKRSCLAVTLVPTLAVSLLLLMGCGQGDGKSGAHESHSGGHAGATDGLLTLNNGEKWEMDEHTRGVVETMSALVAGAKVVSAEDAAELGATLQTQVKTLVQGCTMEGPAHDQLHVFLGEFIPTVATLASTSDVSTGEDTLARITELLSEYGRTFR